MAILKKNTQHWLALPTKSTFLLEPSQVNTLSSSLFSCIYFPVSFLFCYVFVNMCEVLKAPFVVEKMAVLLYLHNDNKVLESWFSTAKTLNTNIRAHNKVSVLTLTLLGPKLDCQITCEKYLAICFESEFVKLITYKMSISNKYWLWLFIKKCSEKLLLF